MSARGDAAIALQACVLRNQDHDGSAGALQVVEWPLHRFATVAPSNQTRISPVADSRLKHGVAVDTPPVLADDDIASLAKRHRVSPGVVREIVRRLGSAERSAVEREIVKGKSRR